MNKDKKLTIIVYENFERKKVLVISKKFIKYFLYIFSTLSFGFLFFFIAFISTKIQENKLNTDNKISLNSINLNTNTNTNFDAINKTYDQIDTLEIENIKFSHKNDKLNFSFQIKSVDTLSSKLNGYITMIARNSHFMYSYPSSFSTDAKKLKILKENGEAFSIKQSKNILTSFPIINKVNYDSVLVLIYSDDGTLIYSNSFFVGEDNE